MTRSAPRVAIRLAVCALIGFASVRPAPAGTLPAPRLEVQRDGAMRRLVVDAVTPAGRNVRKVLRETAADVTPGAAGRDPAGAAAFVTWTEAGSPDPWFAVSEDAGATWMRAASLPDAVLLRDGSAHPGQPFPAPAAGFALPAEGRLFVAQFRTAGLDAWRGALAAAGAEVLSYLPQNAHVVRVDPGLVPALRRLDFVARVEPYHPWYRLEPALRDWIRAFGDPAERLRVNAIAFAWGPAGKARIADAARALGAEVAYAAPSGHVIELLVTREQLRQLAAHDDVQWIDRWSAPEPDMDIVRQDSGADWLEQQTTECGQGVRGEVMDGGVEETHMDFDGLLAHGTHDVVSHGTSTYGIVFGNGDRDGDGSQKATGHLPCAQGIFYDYDNLGDRFVETQELKSAPYFGSFQSNSWGHSLTTDYGSYSQGMDDIIWRLDVAIFQSQSNNGDRQSRPEAWAKNIVSVGAVNHYDTLSTADDCWCGGASIGPAADGRLKPDVSYWYDDIYTTTTGNTYTTGFGGTSAATPISAGIAGLMIEMWSNNAWGTDPQGNTVFERQPHAATIKALMINNAQQYPFTGTGADLTRVHQGWGRPSAKVAKQRAAHSFVIDQTVPLRLGESGGYDVTVASGETELKVTMVYPDPPGTSSASLHRINDLDLTVTSPTGVVYHGNYGLDAGNYSLPGGTRDTKNTVENVFVQNPAAGAWHVEIKAVEINQDAYLATPAADAVFALVVTGATGQICTPPAADFTIAPNPAHVGDAVQFTSTVSGGAGAPFTYAWDLDNDGITDTAADDPAWVYHRPYAGDTQLVVKDAAGCAARVKHAVTITGPDLRYADYVSLTQVEGNSNGAVDPGETWEFTLRLRNNGNEAATGASAGLAVSSASAGLVSLTTTGDASFGSIAVGATAGGSVPFRFQVGSAFPCGEDIVFDVVRMTTTGPANVYPDQVAAVHVLVGGAGPATQFYQDGFETDRGWTFSGNGEWQMNAPLGKGGGASLPGQPKPSSDPTVPSEGTKVLGNDLTGTGANPGNYEANVTSYATSPAMDCSGSVLTKLRLARWLNVTPQDTASVDVSGDGTTWVPLFTKSDGQVEGAWTQLEYDVSSVADRKAGFRVRFGLVSDLNVSWSGWNLDDLRLLGVTRNSCQPYSRPAPGESGGLAVARTAGGLALSWSADCGGGSRFAVYRGDLAQGYASLRPEPGACAIAATSTTVPQGSGAADFFLVVPNDGAFEGSYGKTSGGTQRPPAPVACMPRDAVSSCTP